ncbi:MAG: hypothetical protein ACJ8MH_10920 [Povalibacter sp.]
MNDFARCIACICFAFVSGASQAQSVRWTFEGLLGDAYNFDSKTRIDHPNVDDSAFDGDYDTRGLEGPFHYVWRISRWTDSRAWELQLMHHKLFLQNRPAGVEWLSVSHGFNVVTVNRTFESRDWRFRVGAGPVITHAEASIAGTNYDGPYELAGAAVLIGVDKTISLGSRFFVVGEVDATFGYIESQPSGDPDLEFSISNPALHAQLGLGYRF